MKTALVTGAAGFIGSHLTDRLLAEGWRVIGVDCFADYYPRSIKEANLAEARANAHFQLHDGDLLALAETGDDMGDSLLGQLIAASDVVFHLAAQAGVRASWGTSFSIYTDNNVLATQLVLEACRTHPPSRLIYASSSSVYGDADDLPLREDTPCRPVSPYGVTKLSGEHLCRLYATSCGIPALSLRFFTVYGPRQRPDMAFHRFIRALLAGQPIDVYGDGGQTRDFTYVADIVDGLVAAVSQPLPSSAVLNLGGGSRISLLGAIATLGDVLGRSIEVRHHEKAKGDVRDTWADLTAARDELGYAPQTSLADGLARETEWLQGEVGSV